MYFIRVISILYKAVIFMFIFLLIVSISLFGGLYVTALRALIYIDFKQATLVTITKILITAFTNRLYILAHFQPVLIKYLHNNLTTFMVKSN